MILRSISLLLVRVSLGWLMVLWGFDKIINVEHAVRVSEGFYGGIVSAASVWTGLGYAQVILGLLVSVGLLRRFTYPVLLAVTGTTLLAVWKSIVDPFGLVVEGGNLVFFPSSTIFFAGLVVLAFRSEDAFSVDARLQETGRAGGPLAADGAGGAA